MGLRSLLPITLPVQPASPLLRPLSRPRGQGERVPASREERVFRGPGSPAAPGWGHSPGDTSIGSEDDGPEVSGRGGECLWQQRGPLEAGGLAGHRPLHGHQPAVTADLQEAWRQTWGEQGGCRP